MRLRVRLKRERHQGERWLLKGGPGWVKSGQNQSMKRRIWLVPAFILLFAVPASAQHKSEVSSKFLALESKWNDAYKRGDIDAMNALVADDFIITTEDGLIYSKAG